MTDARLKDAEKARSFSRFAEAEKIYQLLTSAASASPVEKAESLMGLADVQRIQGKFRESLLHYQKARNILELKDPAGAWDARTGWALAARAMGLPKPALRELHKALSFYKETLDLTGEAFAHWALGGTLRITGDLRRGLKELTTALRLFQKLRDSEGISYTHCALGGMTRMLGDYKRSGRYYRKANRQMRRRGDAFGIAYSYCGLGNVERMGGRFQQALPFYRKAEKLYGKIGDRVSYAYTLWSIGTTFKMLGRYSEAQAAFGKADDLFKKTGDTRGRIYTLLGFAEVEWLKAINPTQRLQDAKGTLAFIKHQSNGNNYWKMAKKIADRSDYAWEKLHVKSLRGGKVLDLSKKYREAGSRFYPISIPVNWP